MSRLFTQCYVFKILSGLCVFIHIAIYYSECEYTSFNLSSVVETQLRMINGMRLRPWLQLHSRAAQGPGQKDTTSMKSGKTEQKLATEYLVWER